MAIVKCNEEIEEPASLPPLDEEVNDSSGEHYYGDHVKIGKKLIAVEHDFFTEEITADLPEYDIQAPFLIATRPAGIKDTIRAELGKFWVQETDDKESRMMFIGTMGGFVFGYNIFDIKHEAPVLVETALNIEEYQQTWTLSPNPDLWGDTTDGDPSDVWTAYWQGGSTRQDGFSRPSALIPDGQTFTDHAFEMNTPFSKEELEMFANFSGDIKIADIASDYDFFAKAYEEGIASTTVPENSLPHLYAEIQRGESEAENTIIRDLTTAKTQVKEGYFRQWINSVLSSPDEMNRIAENYENVAILDSVVSEDFILDSAENKTTSAFETLMAYANRENLFPMNVNIEVDTNEASILMEGAESAEMVDDIVRLLMGEGQVIDIAPLLGQGNESSSSAEESTEDDGDGRSSGSNMMQVTTEEEEE